MNGQKTEHSNNLLTTLYSLPAKGREFQDWFSPLYTPFPQNESGEIMRRAMRHNGLLDKLASKWAEQSFWRKITVIVGATLCSGVIGLILNASLLFALTACFFSLLTHAMLIGHETNRRENANRIATETIATNATLQKNEALLQKITNEYNQVKGELIHQNEKIKGLSTRLSSTNEEMNQKIETLVPTINQIQTETIQLQEHQKTVTATLHSMTTNLQTCNKTITAVTDKVETIGQSTEQFSHSIVDIQHSKNELSDAVKKLSFFVTKQSMRKSPSMLSLSSDDSVDCIHELKKQNDADIALISEWRMNIGMA